MEHAEVLELLPAYVDQEVSVSETIRIARHLNDCVECQRNFAQQSQLSAQLKAPAFRYAAPADLAQRINDALPKDRPTPAKAQVGQWQFWKNFGGKLKSVNRFNMGALLAGLLTLFWSIGMFLSLPSAQDRLTDEIISSHVRSLQVDHLSDVVSTDRHTVKPWFNGRLNFSPPVIDLGLQGYPLIGGRLDYLNGHAAAALIYRRQLHPINLYVWPSNEPAAALVTESRDGYHLAHWVAGGMTYWAISDVASGDLATFAALLKTQINRAG
ncbi:anti-sigma factor [Glaciimonas immobilis]|nr:anti-sigma factor [Glaciimonas immobilis]